MLTPARRILEPSVSALPDLPSGHGSLISSYCQTSCKPRAVSSVFPTGSSSHLFHTLFGYLPLPLWIFHVLPVIEIKLVYFVLISTPSITRAQEAAAILSS